MERSMHPITNKHGLREKKDKKEGKPILRIQTWALRQLGIVKHISPWEAAPQPRRSNPHSNPEFNL